MSLGLGGGASAAFSAPREASGARSAFCGIAVASATGPAISTVITSSALKRGSLLASQRASTVSAKSAACASSDAGISQLIEELVAARATCLLHGSGLGDEA